MGKRKYIYISHIRAVYFYTHYYKGEHMKDLNFDVNFKEHPVPLGSRVQTREHLTTPTALHMALLRKSTRRLFL